MSLKQRSDPTMVTSTISVQLLERQNNLFNIEQAWEKYAQANPDEDARLLEVSQATGVQKYVKYCLNGVKVNWIPGLNEPLITIAVKTLNLECWQQEGMYQQLHIDTVVNCKNGDSLLNRSVCRIRTFANAPSEVGEGAGSMFSRIADQPDTSFFYVPKWVTDLERGVPYEVIEIPETMVVYVKEEFEQYFTPLVCRPGTLNGFISAFCRKYGWTPSDVNIRGIFQYVDGNPNHIAWVDDLLFVTFVNKVFRVKMTTARMDENGPAGINVYLIDYQYCDNKNE